MTQTWNDLDQQDRWTLTVDELALLTGMTDVGRLAFAVQLKFLELHGRFPDHAGEIDPAAVGWVAAQLHVGTEGFAAVALDDRQGRRYRRAIRIFLDFRPSTGADLRRMAEWLVSDILPFDPQARHGRDAALEWFRAQRLEPPYGSGARCSRKPATTASAIGFDRETSRPY